MVLSGLRSDREQGTTIHLHERSGRRYFRSRLHVLPRLFPPGFYQVSVESYGHNFFQFRVVALVPGQQAYAKILSLRSWVESGRNFRRDTFYVLIIPPTFAQAEISHYPFLATAEP
jgi:hypothetical protein